MHIVHQRFLLGRVQLRSSDSLQMQALDCTDSPHGGRRGGFLLLMSGPRLPLRREEKRTGPTVLQLGEMHLIAIGGSEHYRQLPYCYQLGMSTRHISQPKAECVARM